MGLISIYFGQVDAVLCKILFIMASFNNLTLSHQDSSSFRCSRRRKVLDNRLRKLSTAKSSTGTVRIPDEKLGFWFRVHGNALENKLKDVMAIQDNILLRTELLRQFGRVAYHRLRSEGFKYIKTLKKALVITGGYIDCCCYHDLPSDSMTFTLQDPDNTKLRIIFNDKDTLETLLEMSKEFTQMGLPQRPLFHCVCGHDCHYAHYNQIMFCDVITDVGAVFLCCDMCHSNQGVSPYVFSCKDNYHGCRSFVSNLCPNCHIGSSAILPECAFVRFQYFTDNEGEQPYYGEAPCPFDFAFQGPEFAQIFGFERVVEAMDNISAKTNVSAENFAKTCSDISSMVTTIKDYLSGFNLSTIATEFLLDFCLTVWQVQKVGLEDSLPCCMMFLKNAFKHTVGISAAFMKRYNFTNVITEHTQVDGGAITAMASFVALIGGWFIQGKDYSVDSFVDVSKYVTSFMHSVFVSGKRAYTEMAAVLNEAFDEVLVYFGMPPESYLGKLKARCKAATDWIVENDVGSVRYQNDILTNSSKRNDVERVHLECVEILALLKNLHDKRLADSFIITFEPLKVLYTKVIIPSQACKARARMRPVCVMFQGKPGQGKTVVTQAVMTALLDVIWEIKCTEEDKNIHIFEYTTNTTGKDNYITGLTSNHKIMHWSDVFLVSDKDMVPSEDMAMLMRLVDTAAFNTPQADIMLKGKVNFEVPIIILTSNIRDYPVALPSNIVDPGAVVRRIDFYLRVTADKVAIKKMENKGQLDIVKYLGTKRCGVYFTRSFYTQMENQLTTFKQSGVVKLNFVDTCVAIVKKYNHYKRQHEALLRDPVWLAGSIEEIKTRMKMDEQAPWDEDEPSSDSEEDPSTPPPSDEDDDGDNGDDDVQQVPLQIPVQVPIVREQVQMIADTPSFIEQCGTRDESTIVSKCERMYGDIDSFCDSFLNNHGWPIERTMDMARCFLTGIISDDVNLFRKHYLPATTIPRKKQVPFLWFFKRQMYYFRFTNAGILKKGDFYRFEPITDMQWFAFQQDYFKAKGLMLWELKMRPILNLYVMHIGLFGNSCIYGGPNNFVVEGNYWNETFDTLLDREIANARGHADYFDGFRNFCKVSINALTMMALVYGGYCFMSWVLKPKQIDIDDKIEAAKEARGSSHSFPVEKVENGTVDALSDKLLSLIDSTTLELKEKNVDVVKTMDSFKRECVGIVKLKEKEKVESLKKDNVPGKAKQIRPRECWSAKFESLESGKVDEVKVTKKDKIKKSLSLVPENVESIKDNLIMTETKVADGQYVVEMKNIEHTQSVSCDYSEYVQSEELSDFLLEKIESQEISLEELTAKLDPDSDQLRASLAWNKVMVYIEQNGSQFKVDEGLFVTARTMITVAHSYSILKNADFIIIYRLQSNIVVKAKPEEIIFVCAKYNDGSFCDLMSMTFQDIIFFPNIMRHIVLEEDMPKYKKTYMVLVSMYEYSTKSGKREILMRETHIMTAEFQDNFKYFPVPGAFGATKHIEGDYYVVRKCIRYFASTAPSWCGAVAVALNKFLPRKILGLHISGGAKSGTSVCITRQMVQSIIPEVCQITYIPRLDLMVENGMAAIKAIRSEEENITILGDASPFKGSAINLGRFALGSASKKTCSIEKSALYGFVEPTKAPAELNCYEVDGVKVDPVVTAWGKLDADHVYIDMKDLEIAATDAFADMYVGDWKEYTQEITIDEAIHGRDGDEFYNSLNLNASGGPILKNMTEDGKPGKRTWICHEPKFIADCVRKAVADRFKWWDLGIRFLDHFSAELKSELRALAKVLSPRLYNAGDMITLICGKMMYAGFNAYLAKNWTRIGATLGINVYRDFGHLRDLLQVRGPHVFDGDFSRFDGSLCSRILYVVLKHINKWITAGIGPAHKMRRKVHSNIIRYATIVVRGFLVMLNHSNPSGNFKTTGINCFVVKVGLRLVWLDRMRNLKPELNLPIIASMQSYRRHIWEAVNGDDNVVNVSELASRYFNQETAMEGFMKLGMTYTDPSKTDRKCQVKKITDVSYLKRRFLLEGCAGALDKETIEQNIQWLKRDISSLDNFESSMDVALAEAYFHGKEYYVWLRNAMMQKLQGTSFERLILPTYDDMLCRHLAVNRCDFPAFQ